MSLPTTCTLVQRNEESASEPFYADVISIAGDGSYPTGGSPVANLVTALQAKTKDLRTPFSVIPQDCGGYIVAFDAVNSKLKVYNCGGSGSPGSEVTNATNLSGVTLQLLILSV